MNPCTTFLRTAALGVLCLFSHSVSAFADQEGPRTIELRVAAQFEPQHALGFLIGQNGTKTKKVSSITPLSDGMYAVTVPFELTEVRRDTVATALVTGNNGEIAYADTRQLGGNTARTFESLTECPSEEITQPLNANQIGPYEKLAQLRKARREIDRLSVLRMMDGKFLDSLRTLERGFGLARTSELSADLPPQELVDRLFRLSVALKAFAARNRNAEKSPDSASPPVNSEPQSDEEVPAAE